MNYHITITAYYTIIQGIIDRKLQFERYFQSEICDSTLYFAVENSSTIFHENEMSYEMSTHPRLTFDKGWSVLL